MIETFRNAWRVPELRKKLLFTFFIIIISLPQACVVQLAGNAVDQKDQDEIDHGVEQPHCGGKAELPAG